MFFGTVRSQFFYRKSWYSPPRHKVFWYPKLFETQKGSSTKWFGTVRPKKRPKIVLPLPLLCMDVLDTKTFLKHRRVPLQCFSVLWDRKFPTEKRDIPLLSIKFFDNRNVLKHRRVLLRKFFSLWNKKFSTENLDTPPATLLSKIFRYPEILNDEKIALRNFFFGTARQKKFDGEYWYSLPPPPPSPLIHNLFRYQNFCETQNGSPTMFFSTVR